MKKAPTLLWVFITLFVASVIAALIAKRRDAMRENRAVALR
jgi:ABC-type microcin C transport system permease subunit YejE